MRVTSSNFSKSAWSNWILAILCFETAYVAFTSKHALIWTNTSERLIDRDAQPVLFVVFGSLLILLGAFLIIRGVQHIKTSSSSSDQAVEAIRAPVHARQGLWLAINSGMVLLSPLIGFSEKFATGLDAGLSRNNFIMLTVIAVALCLFVIGTAHNATELRRPSWTRSPFHWESDALQAIFISQWTTFGLLLGSVLRLCRSQGAQLDNILIYCSMFVGLVAGYMLIKQLYRRRILANPPISSD